MTSTSDSKQSIFRNAVVLGLRRKAGKSHYAYSHNAATPPTTKGRLAVQMR